jgi:hypothetical protein
VKRFLIDLVFYYFYYCDFRFALIIDLRRKKNNNNPHFPTNPNAKPGDSSNYMMGDNRYTGGGVIIT